MCYRLRLKGPEDKVERELRGLLLPDSTYRCCFLEGGWPLRVHQATFQGVFMRPRAESDSADIGVNSTFAPADSLFRTHTATLPSPTESHS